jgi:hypothetical protein
MLYGVAILVYLLTILLVLINQNIYHHALVKVNFVRQKLVYFYINSDYKAGDATVKEDIRQKIIYNDYRNRYLTYIAGFSRNCLKIFQQQFYAEDCAASLLNSLGINHQDL